MLFGFKNRVFCPALKKVLERGLLIPQALLQRNTGNVVQESSFRQFFDGSQLGTRFRVPNFFLSLIVGIRAVTQDAVVNVAHTTERLSQQRFLLWVWVESELVGAFSFHYSQNIVYFVKSQQPKIANQTEEREEGRLSPTRYPSPCLKAGVSRARLMKNRRIHGMIIASPLLTKAHAHT